MPRRRAIHFRGASGPELGLLSAVLAAGLFVGCQRADGRERASLGLELVLPRQSDGIFLNESLDLYFTAPLDRSSVTHGISVVDEAGEPVAGRLEVDGAHVRFVPEPVLAADLSDGGLRPGGRYAIQIAGFPRPESLRSAEGGILPRSMRYEFRTLSLEESERLFADNHPDREGRLEIVSDTIPPDGPLVLLCREEPIDPASLPQAELRLRQTTPKREPALEVELEPRLVRDVDASLVDRLYSHQLEVTAPGRLGVDPHSASLLELTPRERLSPGIYELVWTDDSAVTDFTGNPIRIVAAQFTSRTVGPIYVVEGTSIQRGEYEETFSDAHIRTPIAVPSADGAALWARTGRVEIRYPAAAGNGADGAVNLAETEPRGDVHSTELLLPEDTTTQLSDALGLVVLRSQGRMTISGSLEREVPKTAEELSTLLHTAGSNPFAEAGSLSTWLDRARAEDLPWTVLVAGADLVIEGRVRSNTPLLLVAGGLVRITGEVECTTSGTWVYLLGDGGGLQMSVNVEAKPAQLTIDPPHENPLRRGLTFAVVSGPIPQHGVVRRWLSSEVGGEHNLGEYRVRFLDEDLPMDEADWRPVGDPRQLEGSPAIRLLIELEVPAKDAQDDGGRRWDPPFVDYVRLFWD